MNNKKIASLISLLTLSFIGSAAAVPAPPPPTVTVDYGGNKYTISSQSATYTGNPSLLTSQPWWGNSSLSFALADLVRMQAGGYRGGPSDPAGALFGYGTNSGYVSIAYWENFSLLTRDCPISCPLVGDTYYYAILLGISPDITLASLQQSLLSTNQGLESMNANVNMLVNGAHSRPLARLVAPGEKTAWVAGDFGLDDHGSHNGTLGVAEIGGGYNFGPAQVNLSLGQTWANQQLTESGHIRADGNYVMVEGIIPVSKEHGLYATLGTYGLWGQADIRRGYINGGVHDSSSASPDTNTWGVRARIDWEKAVEVKSIAFSPYADLSYTDTKLDGYTESNGGLPARFDSRSDRNTELRGGLNADMPILSSRMSLVANLEAAHRFEDRAARASGEVIGLFGFDVTGEKLHTDWIKAGVGVEGKLGEGKASLMLNGTTKSDMPNLWLAASYQLTF